MAARTHRAPRGCDTAVSRLFRRSPCRHLPQPSGTSDKAPVRGVALAATVAKLRDLVEFAKHLLVDGYNIAHAWPGLRRVLAKEGRDMARAQLVERIRVLHDFERMRVSIVFDGRGADIAIERPTPHATFSVLYTPGGMTADDLIEQLTVQSPRPAEVFVATADQAERDTIEAAGAQAISPEQLAEWVTRVEHAQQAAVGAHRRRTEKQWRQGGRA